MSTSKIRTPNFWRVLDGECISNVKGGIPDPVLTESPPESPSLTPVEERSSLELKPLDTHVHLPPSVPLPSTSLPPSSPPSASSSQHRFLKRSTSHTALLAPPGRKYTSLRKGIDPSNVLRFPRAVNLPAGLDIQALPAPSRHFVCLTIGSRGDVQPYIALGKRLKSVGHRVTIVTHAEYKEWIEGFGLDHREAGGDPGALMLLSVENKVS